MELTIPAIIAAIISAIISYGFKHLYERKLEIAKSSLAIEAKRKEILLTKLREEQAEVFRSLYEKMALMFHQMWNVSSSGFEDEAVYKLKLNEFWRLSIDFWQYWTTHRIFVPSDIDQMLSALYLKLRFTVGDFEYMKKNEEISRERFISASALREECDIIKKAVEDRFRIILGVSELYDASTMN